MKAVGIADLALHLQFGDAPGDFGIHADVEILGLLHQQELVDLIAQGVGGFLFHRLLQFETGKAILTQLRLDTEPSLLEFAAGDNVVVHFGDDLFDDADIRGRGYGNGSR
jgi:hypothetical protein